MKPVLVKTRVELSQAIAEARKHSGKAIGFVPTMGALHEGHGSLIAASRSAGCLPVVSIFVNPTQFGPNEDFSQYPRTLPADMDLAERFGASIVFAPDAELIYPPGFATTIDVGKVALPLCGTFRPGHFLGVATVVHRLFTLVRPDLAFFGQKDLQQCLVLHRMVLDLEMPVQLRFEPTIRSADGLALSSRNRYLSSAEREVALVVPQALRALAEAVELGKSSVPELLALAHRVFAEQPEFRLQYLEIRTLPDLGECSSISGLSTVAAVAGFVGKTRLIDNRVLSGSFPGNRQL